MESDKTVGILSEIGRVLAADVRGAPDAAFLYTEAAQNMVATSIFEELDDRVVYHNPSMELDGLILAAWESAPGDKKWNALFYTISGDTFDARFQYPDEDWDEEESAMDRRDRVLEAKYGDKPIDYSDP